jgi:spermidine synthase
VSGRPRAPLAYALLAPACALALWYHVVAVLGGAYLLLDVAAPSAPLAAMHAAGLAAGVWALGRLAPRGAPGPAALGVAQALVGAGACAAAPALFASASAFGPGAFAFALAFGVASGAFARAFASALPALLPSPAALLRALRVEVLALALAAAALGPAVAHRGGLVRTGLGLAVLACVAAHLGASAALAPRASRGAARAAAWSSYALCAALALVEPLAPWTELTRAPDPLVLARRGPWGQLLLTSGRGAFQLYADASLRLSTIDAHRAREALAHPALAAAERRGRVLVVGGGDGAVLREALRYGDVAEVTLVEPDEALVALARTQPVLARENGGALDAPNVRVVHEDPLPWLARGGEPFDVALLDLGEPDAPRRSKLYTSYFFGLVRARLADGGVGAVRTAPPLSSPRAHWCVVRTLEAAGLAVLPYRAGLPATGEQGYALFGRARLARPDPARLPGGLAFVDAETLAALFDATPDTGPLPVEVNRLYHQVLSSYRDEAAP